MSVQKKCRKPDDDGAIVVGWTVDVIHSTMVALLPLKKIIIVSSSSSSTTNKNHTTPLTIIIINFILCNYFIIIYNTSSYLFLCRVMRDDIRSSLPTSATVCPLYPSVAVRNPLLEQNASPKLSPSALRCACSKPSAPFIGVSTNASSGFPGNDNSKNTLRRFSTRNCELNAVS